MSTVTQTQILAIHGGTPVRTRPFPAYITIGEEEKRAVQEVLDSTVLSQFLGTWSPEFYGGPRVRALEEKWARYFGVQHAVSMNSATSGLYAAVGAAGVGPGDEVIVSPYTMSASAAGPLLYNALPVFADIDPDTFCITADTIRQRLSPRTRAIIVVDLFGQPAVTPAILALAREHKLVVIEDAAQAPGARDGDRYAGTMADMGVFSLNYHKTIHTGEGGVVVTDNADFAERLQLIRNHAEVVVKAKGTRNLVNLLGFNYRMGEIEAAIASVQLDRLEGLVQARVEAAEYLARHLQALPGLKTPAVQPGIRHGYYLYALRYARPAGGASRHAVAEALRAEGIPVSEGYVEPIYLEPMYQQRLLFGSGGCPFTCGCAPHGQEISYAEGLCPVTERMHREELLYTPLCHAGMQRQDLDDVVQAFAKVMTRQHELV